MSEPSSQPQPPAPGYGVPATIAGISGVVAMAIANVEKLTPFLEKFGMNALIVLTGLGLITLTALKILPKVEQMIDSNRTSNERLSENYHNQTAILGRMDERQASDSNKLDELHREVVVKKQIQVDH